MNFQIVQILQNAIVAIQANEFIAAQSLLNEVLRIEKNQPDALRFLGVIAALQKDWDQALRLIDLAIECNPQNGVAHSNRGNILVELGRSEEALLAYENAINLQPSYAEAHSNRGNVLQALGRYQEALTSYEKAVQIDPNYAQAFYGVARLFLLRKQYDYAFGCCEQALKINPRYEEALALKGEILFEIKDYSKALTVYDELLLLNSNSCEAWISKGNIFSEIKQFLEAGFAYEKALEISSNTEFLLGITVQTHLQMCDWEFVSNKIENLIRLVCEGKRVAIPYNFISLLDDRKLIKRSIEIYAKALKGDIQREPQECLSAKKKIRLGYFSADFHNHPTAYLIAELFECHDKSKFELIAFVFGRNTPDTMRSRLERAFDDFIDLNGMTDEEAAKLSRDKGIDIAIDLKGFTKEGRPRIFMYGAAPIQISYLGFPGTMGLPCFDYVIADDVVIPQEFRDGIVEKVIYMPNCYQVNDRNRPISTSTLNREEFGLPASGFIFCCFNNNYKITPVVFDGWVRILDSVKDSVLWLYEDNPYAKENLKQEFRKRGLDANRLIFAGRMDLSNHLARYQLADLFLDTTPCNAHTTASDALWAGLPVLTVIGQSFGSRVAASLLKSVGLPELITNNQAEYERLAIELATKPTKIHEFKSRLKRNILLTPLFDTVKFTKNLEIAFQEVFRRKHANLAPDHIHVSQVNPR